MVSVLGRSLCAASDRPIDRTIQTDAAPGPLHRKSSAYSDCAHGHRPTRW
jgi:hypothetical protein